MQKKKTSKRKAKEIKEIKKALGEPTNAEIRELEKELKYLQDKDTTYGSPRPPSANRGMDLILLAGEFAVFKNTDGILFQIGAESEDSELVLKKIKVVV